MSAHQPPPGGSSGRPADGGDRQVPGSYPPAPTGGQGAPGPAHSAHPGGAHPGAGPGAAVRSAATGHTYPQAVRPGGFAPSPAQYGTMAATYAPPQNTSGDVSPMWDNQQRGSNRWVFNIIVYVIGAVMMMVLIGIIMYSVDAPAALAGFLLALFPLTIVLAGIVWLDRWEPEPKSLLLVALLWGAGVSTLVSFFVNTAVITFVAQSIFDATGDVNYAVAQADLIGPVIVAPVVEEVTKGLGVLAIFLLRREHFDGPVDGVVYAATVGAGFAFTENILYFARSSDYVWVVFVMRGLASPFAHAIFTACIGVALGLVAKRRWTTAVFLAFPAGLIGAMGLHALWNGSASLGEAFLLLYLVVQIPLFVLTILLMAWLRKQESNVIRARLSEYAQAGWFAGHEVDMLASLRMRGHARQWASRFGASAKEAMRAFQRDATRLAYQRQHVLTGRGQKRAHPSEHELLNKLQQDRSTFLAHSQGNARA